MGRVTVRLANLMVAFAGLAFAAQVIGLFAFLGKVGYELGWWGDDLGPISVAVALGTAVAVALLVGLQRWAAS
jgi:hypothetical protein